MKQEDDGLETIDCAEHDKRRSRDGLSFTSNKVNQVDDVCDSDRLNECRKQVDENDSAHRAAAETTEPVDTTYEFGQIMDGRVDPATSL